MSPHFPACDVHCCCLAPSLPTVFLGSITHPMSKPFLLHLNVVTLPLPWWSWLQHAFPFSRLKGTINESNTTIWDHCSNHYDRSCRRRVIRERMVGVHVTWQSRVLTTVDTRQTNGILVHWIHWAAVVDSPWQHVVVATLRAKPMVHIFQGRGGSCAATGTPLI